jgi:hypothetical protein
MDQPANSPQREDLCEKCGEPFEIGDWPFCPHGAYRGGVIGDDIPGGVLIHHMEAEPIRFYSKSAIKKAAFERGLTHGYDTPKPNQRIIEREQARKEGK